MVRKKDQPITVDFMRLSQERMYPGWSGMITEFPSGKRVISLRRSEGPRKLSRVFSHEFGHTRYPTSPGIQTWKEDTRDSVEYVFGELCANYYALKSHPDFAGARREIRQWKKEAREEIGLTRSQIAKLDSIARRRVGYSGKEVK